VVAGQGQIVAVVGEPGMGKSRLLAEYRRTLAGREVRYVEGHCLSYGSATPYLPLVDLVRQLCAITPEEQYEVITATIHHRLQQADVDLDEGVPLLLSLLDIPLTTERLAQLSPPERRARTFALLRHLILHEAQYHPCILALENLHWSDATSEAWLTSLVERLAGAALLVLVTYRPGYQPPWLAQSHATQIALSPLRARDSRTVVQAALQSASVPEIALQEIVTQAAGNPFFLEELAWNVIEHAGQPAPLAVPETIEAVLAARIDRLPPEEKRLLQTAAVIGMDVAVPLLQAVTDLATAELHTHLGHLQTAEFLYEAGRLPASAYTFKHALTYEVAYGSLLQERRRVLHGRTAQAIEEFFAERLPEHYYALAYHYSRSGNSTRAVDYLQRAGQQAVERSAYAEAVSHLSTALDLLTTLPETRERSQQELGVLMILGAVLRVTKGQAALTLAQQLVHPLSLTMALRWAAVLHHLRREVSLTQTRAEAAMTMATDHGFPQQVAVAMPLRGWALAASGQGVEGIAQIRQGLSAFRAMGATRDRLEHLALLSEASAQVGQTTEGLVALAEALATLD